MHYMRCDPSNRVLCTFLPPERLVSDVQQTKQTYLEFRAVARPHSSSHFVAKWVGLTRYKFKAEHFGRAVQQRYRNGFGRFELEAELVQRRQRHAAKWRC